MCFPGPPALEASQDRSPGALHSRQQVHYQSQLPIGLGTVKVASQALRDPLERVSALYQTC